MHGECLIIAFIILVLSAGFFRAKRKNWGFAVLPLGLVPLVVGVGMYIAEQFFGGANDYILPVILTLSSLVISCIWLGITNTILIKTKKVQIAYLTVSFGFEFTLSLILLLRYYWLLGTV